MRPNPLVRAAQWTTQRGGSLALLVVLLLVWQFGSTRTFVIPSVPDTLSELRELMGDDEFWTDLRYTVQNIAVAFAISVVAGTLLGVALGSLVWARRAFEPSVAALNSLPKLVLYPLLLQIFDVGPSSQIVMGVLHGIFPMTLMVSGAVAGIAPIYVKLGRSLECTRVQQFRHITAAAIRKPFLTGMRLSMSVTTIGVVLSEFFITRDGLGKVIASSYEFGRYDELMAATLVLLTFSFAVSFVLWLAEKRVPA